MDQERYPILDRIPGPQDVKKLSEELLPALAEELRQYMIETTSRTGESP